MILLINVSQILFPFCSKPAMDPDLICGNAQVLTAQCEHLLGLPPLLDYTVSQLLISLQSCWSLPAPWTSIHYLAAGPLCRLSISHIVCYITLLPPSGLYLELSFSKAPLLPFYLFFQLLLPNLTILDPIYPDLLPHFTTFHFLTYCIMIPLFIMFIIHFMSTCIRK